MVLSAVYLDVRLVVFQSLNETIELQEKIVVPPILRKGATIFKLWQRSLYK